MTCSRDEELAEIEGREVTLRAGKPVVNVGNEDTHRHAGRSTTLPGTIASFPAARGRCPVTTNPLVSRFRYSRRWQVRRIRPLLSVRSSTQRIGTAAASRAAA